jgi:hypothetical protein
MAATPYVLPRETRESAVGAGNGTVGPYAPSLYKVFDTVDVKVFAKALGETMFSDVTAGCTIAKVNPANAYDYFTVTFGAAVPATTAWYHQARRVAERSVAVTKGGTLDSNQLEKELSKQATVESEVRRDLDRAVSVAPGTDPIVIIPGAQGEVPKFDAGGNLVSSGENVETIEGATAAAIAARDAARKWATEAENVGVNDGVNPPGFSAFNWARKAFTSAVAAAASAATIALPVILPNTMLIAKADASGYDAKPSPDVRTFLGTAPNIRLKANLKALDTTKETAAFYDSSIWLFTAGDYTARIALDTQEGIYMKADAVGANAGAWVRQFQGPLRAAWFGAVGDGVTNDRPAIQVAENVRASLAGELRFSSLTYQIDATNISVNRAAGGTWTGEGQAMLRASANNTFLCVLGSAVVGTTNKPFRVTGLHFHGGGFTGVRGVHETSPFGTTIENCTFTQMAYCASFIGNSVLATQTGWLQISNVRQYGGGSWAFYGFDNTTYLFHVEMNNIHQVGTGSAANWENAFWIEGRRCVGLSINNCWSGSLDGGADGLLMRGDCQGVFVTNSTFVWPKVGINSLTWTDTLKPAYVYMSNVGVDQHTTSGAEIEGRTWFITNANFANGSVRTNTGQACLLKSTCTDMAMQNALFAYDQKSGLVVQNGAKKIRVGNFTAENNNVVAGANYEVDLGASPFVDVALFGRNVIGAAGVNATGQRVVNGITSPAVSKSNSAASTTAVTTQEDLKTYTIPASTLKVGQKLRLRAFGTTAANANTKTIRLWFGGNSIADHTGAWNAIPWVMTAEIEITAANTQWFSSMCVPSANSPTSRQGSLAVVDTAAIIVKATGQNGTASAGDITCNGFEVTIVD